MILYKLPSGFAVPKTPVGVSKTSKPKVKTPVVTVTPPAGSKKKTKKKSAKEPKDNEEIGILFCTVSIFIQL